MNGGLEQLCTLLTDPCLAKCIELLGDNSDNPTEEQLLKATPTLIDEFGLAITRLMIATSVAGEATAAEMLSSLLRHHDTLALPPTTRVEIEVRPSPQADDDTKARRRAAKERRQADAAARRVQQQRAKHR